MNGTVVTGHVLSPETSRQTSLENVAFLIGPDGLIQERAAAGTPLHRALCARDRVVSLRPGTLLIPGVTDLHIHAPQWPQAGTALDRPLEEWLGACTFPLEARYADLAFAEAVYDDLIRTLLENGTATALYFATIHEEASLALARTCLRHGQRGLVGLVAMDHPDLCPPGYRQASADDALNATRRFIHAVRALPGNENGLVQPVITPRFIPACSDTLLRGLGQLAAELDVRVQTHASESDWEHQHVLDRTGQTDTCALDAFGLLRSHTVLAHAGFLNRDDRTLVRERNAALAHCPISNAFFAGAALPVRAVLDEHVHCGLGTDISGGYSPSIFENARQAVLTSRLLESGTDPALPTERRGLPDHRIDFQEAFWLATRGGAEALGLPAGQLKVGQMFDAIEILGTAGALRLHPQDSATICAEKIVCHASPQTIGRVWVNGVPVKAQASIT
ncbi:amidohydrolase family protein [Gluconobacter morbifer]|uniref:Putative guanine deaminase n=1 Tax=Gluconobacter morbifer G707 TaxID=1088869 RepID=G6XEU9_9PROT|nr:amidohydrolase family protein [Gluconobacter morbifer]EHH68707.1 putative guanine deaminase [Gluconobacter morbifer G707]